MLIGNLTVDGHEIGIEVVPPSGPTRAGMADKLHAKWEDAQAVLVHLVGGLHGSIEEMGEHAPAEAELEFGLTLSAEAGWVVGKAGGQVNFRIKLTWK